MTPVQDTYICIGSNLGDKGKNCRNGIDRLADCDHIDLIQSSRIYRTDPVDYLDQDWFINQVIHVATRLDPFQLLDCLKRIEQAAGRGNDAIRFGPRILDMDIIFYADRIMSDQRLILPHPRMHLRRFVLQPLCDIAPGLIHPVLRVPVHHLLANLNDSPSGVYPVDA